MKKRVQYKCRKCDFTGRVWVHRSYLEGPPLGPNQRKRWAAFIKRHPKGPHWAWSRPRCPHCSTRAKGSVFLVCWCSWDYDFHEEPREAYRTKARAKKRISDLIRFGDGQWYSNADRGAGGWSVMEVELGPVK